MGKANKVKGELIEAKDLVELIQVLKDVADLKYRALSTQKSQFLRFGESFSEFFRLIAFSRVNHPLVSNNNSGMGYVAVTTEQGFVGDLNTKVITRVLEEKEKHPDAVFIGVGRKGVAKLEQLGAKSAANFEDVEEKGLYETAVAVKDYVVEQVMTNKLGHVAIIYPWAKDFTTIKPRLIRLLPCEDLLPKQSQSVERLTQVIEESDSVDMIGYLADIWLSCRIYEILFDTTLAAAAAQAQQLDSSLGKMKKESIVVKLKYRKAKKSDIDNSLREVFSAKMMAEKK